MPTNEGSIRGKCCFKCRWRNPPLPDSKLPKEPPGPNGEIRIDWTKTRVCDHNPDGMFYCGNVYQVCDLFELDRERYVTPILPRWKYEAMKKHGKKAVPLDFFN